MTSRRLPTALVELKTLAPDVACLQEVDEKYVETFWRPQLEALGYEVWFASKEGGAREGLLTAVSTKKGLTLVGRRVVSLKFPYTDSKGIEHSVITVAQIGTIVVDFLGGEEKKKEGPPPRRLTVANAHLFYASGAVAVRFEQMKRLLDDERPTFLVGDLNAFPTSAAIQLATTGKVDQDHPDLRGGATTTKTKASTHHDDDDEKKNNRHILTSAYDLSDFEPSWSSSADDDHDDDSNQQKKKKCTHAVDGFRATLDYILGDRPAVATLAVPEDAPPLPTADYPSDHFLIAADFELDSSLF
mmetsp:Transcript_27240/g.88035  ORF Transcript_27240/g.88035 Transcript_27240/m.88035 type:complete len:301 (-) Transcript_27240:7-909(-)